MSTELYSVNCYRVIMTNDRTEHIFLTSVGIKTGIHQDGHIFVRIDMSDSLTYGFS